MRRRSPASLLLGSALFAAAPGCAKLLGFEHGVPASAECATCASGQGGVATAGRGAWSGSSSGGVVAGTTGGTHARPPGTGGSEFGIHPAGGETGGSRAIRSHDAAGESSGAAAGRSAVAAGGEAGDGGATAAGTSGGGGESGSRECSPGASEICDGLDNDCNGRRDLEDGLALDADDRSLPDEHGSALVSAYLSDPGRFVMAWKPDPRAAPGIAYSLVDREGNATGGGFIASADGAVGELALASGESEFAILWSSDSGVYFQRISAEGELGPSTTVATALDVPGLALAFTAGGWTAFWQDFELWARRVERDDTLGPVVKVGFTVDAAPMQATVSGDAVLLVWRFAELYAATIISRSLVGGTDLKLGFGDKGLPIYASAAGARPEGFGVLGSAGTDLLFQIFDRTGARRCGPVKLPESSYWFDVAPSTHGFVVLGDHALDELDLDCRLVEHAGGPGFTLPGAPRLVSAGADGYLLTWQDFNTDPPKLGFRRIGPHFCD